MAEIKSGYVHKCGNTVKSWKRRWFVLKANGYLYYYEDKSSTSKQEKGKIDLVDASKVGEWKEISTVNRKLPSGFSSSNAFGIVAGDRTFTCVCENDGESQSWLAAFARVRNPDNQEYPEPTYPKEKQTAPEPEAPPVEVKKELPLSAARPAPADLTYGGSLPRHSHISQPPPEEPVMSNTLPRAKARPTPEPMPSVPATNPYYTPEVKEKLASQQPPPQAPPPAYQRQAPPPQYGGAPPQQYRPPPPQQPYYRPPPPQQYRPPPQQQYRPPPQPQYRPPPQPQYRPPPQQYYGPPQPQYRPPPQPQYRQPPPQAYCHPGVRGPYASQPRPPPPVQSVQRKTTTVMVVTVPAQQQVIHRRR